MPLDATARIQSNSGLASSTTSIPASLTNPTTDGSTLLMYFAASGGAIAAQLQSYDPPLFTDTTSSSLVVFRRDAQPAGETSWTITASTSTSYYWRVEEWVGLSFIGQPDAKSTLFTGTGNPVSTNAAVPDVNDFAALAVFTGLMGAGATGWPARTYPAGWSEVAFMPGSTGGPGDFAMAIAESYPGISGSMTGSITWDNSGGGTIPSQTYSWLGCYQPAAVVPIQVSVSP